MNIQNACCPQLPLSVRNEDSSQGIGQIVNRLVSFVQQKIRGAEGKRQLKRLNDHQLNDIGLTRNEIDVEGSRQSLSHVDQSLWWTNKR